MMMISKYSEIDNLVISKLPAGKKLAVEQAIRVNGITLILAKNGRIYSDQLKDFAYLPGKHPWQPSVMKALKRLGIISAGVVKGYQEECKAAEKRRQIAHAKKMIKRYGPIAEKTS